MTFQRARSHEQREVRRAAILSTTTAMLHEMAVADITLNELSRRVGLAKSNVLRYFESREAILLELLDGALEGWLIELRSALDVTVDAQAEMPVRAHQVSDVLSRTLAHQNVLCDLFGAQGGVLEHNVSVKVVRRHKRSSLVRLATMTDLMLDSLPELGESAQWLCVTTLVLAGAMSTYVPPPPSLLEVYAEEPELGTLHLDLRDALNATVLNSLFGALPRSEDLDPRSAPD